jgi:hypothetical protein
MCHVCCVAGTGGVTYVSRVLCCGHWRCYMCVTPQEIADSYNRRGAVKALEEGKVLQMCHVCCVAGTGGVTNASRVLCCGHWWCYICVTCVVLRTLAVLHMCDASGDRGLVQPAGRR